MTTKSKCIRCQALTDELWCDKYCQACWESFAAGVWSDVLDQLRGLGQKTR